MSSIKKNYIYNMLYNCLILVLPLITAPYLARVVGTIGVGIYSYTFSIAQYFVLFSMLGLTNYGNRMIAKSKKNKDELSENFWSIFYMQLMTTFISFTIFLCFLFLNNSEYKTIFIIQALYVFSSFLDINWFFFGMEKFKLTVTRNFLIKILSTILIFIFVKSYNDLWIYTLIISLSTLISHLALWPFVKKEVNYCKFDYKKVKKHFKKNLILFIPVVAVSLYNIMDKIMLGLISSKVEVGLYENAEKIINVPTTIINALGIVMLPKISNLLSLGNEETVSKYLNKSLTFVSFLAFPIFWGTVAISEKFVIIFYGQEFEKTGILIEILAIIIIFKTYANVIRTQYLIPSEKDNIYIKSVILGAVINLTMNFLFIYKFQSIGACIGTIAAEFIVMIYQFLHSKNIIDYQKLVITSLPFCAKGIIMFILIKCIDLIELNYIYICTIQVILGVMIYAALNYKYILSSVDIKRFFKASNT